MSGFGYIYAFYLLLVILEIWLVFRPDIVRLADKGKGIVKVFYTVLALGSSDVSEETLKVDRKVTLFLASVGIPSACILHGYVGFLFGSLKSNPWWSTPLMPVIFLLSAIVSGISVLAVSYVVVMKIKKQPVDSACLKSLFTYLWAFFILDVTLESLEVITMLYESHEEWHIISQMLTQKLGFSYIFLQMAVCSVIPLLCWVLSS